jgi:hypothetical protein
MPLSSGILLRFPDTPVRRLVGLGAAVRKAVARLVTAGGGPRSRRTR